MSSTSDFAPGTSKAGDPDTLASSNHLDRLLTAGGHVNDRSQLPLPVVHRSFANPTPLGLISFAAGIHLPQILPKVKM
jgi:hypothetical protein